MGDDVTNGYPKFRGHKNRFKRMGLAISLAASSLAALMAPLAAQAQQASVSVSIAAQPLGDALVQFAQQAHLQLGVDATLLAGKRSPGVTGRMDRARALDRLLAGSGLDWRIADGVLTVQQAPVHAAGGARQEPLVTDALQVEGDAARATWPKHAPSAAMTRSSTLIIPADTRTVRRSNATRASRRRTC
ncbi:hypothetical protein GCM10020258_31500 [Sphingomonas yabuuchiae]